MQLKVSDLSVKKQILIYLVTLIVSGHVSSVYVNSHYFFPRASVCTSCKPIRTLSRHYSIFESQMDANYSMWLSLGHLLDIF